jgi:hypothetical protein
MPGMKAVTISLVLGDKVEKWLASIDDTAVRNLASANTIVAGGAIASLLAGEKLNDYDLYFRNEETTLAVAQYYINVYNKGNGGKDKWSPQLRTGSRCNIKGNLERRVWVHMQSAGVAAVDTPDYKYFERRPEMETQQFADALADAKAIGDIDIEDEPEDGEEYLPNPVAVTETVLEKLRDKKQFQPVFFSENAISLSGKVQVVTRFFGEPSEIIDNYDFAHAMCSYDHGKKQLNLHSEALEAILSKTLLYRGSLYPVASVFRLRKFIKRGWRISAGQILKILFQLNEVDLREPKMLREQLIGVDQAYMYQLLRAIENNDGARIDATYLATIIDTIFEGDANIT